MCIGFTKWLIAVKRRSTQVRWHKIPREQSQWAQLRQIQECAAEQSLGQNGLSVTLASSQKRGARSDKWAQKSTDAISKDILPFCLVNLTILVSKVTV